LEGNTEKYFHLKSSVLPDFRRAIHFDVLPDFRRAIQYFSDGNFLCIALQK
jgi:hypothetical protein